MAVNPYYTTEPQLLPPETEDNENYEPALLPPVRDTISHSLTPRTSSLLATFLPCLKAIVY